MTVKIEMSIKTKYRECYCCLLSYDIKKQHRDTHMSNIYINNIYNEKKETKKKINKRNRMTQVTN